jgi:hypothetical protein
MRSAPGFTGSKRPANRGDDAWTSQIRRIGGAAIADSRR